MNNLISSFPNHITQALSIFSNSNIKPANQSFSNVLIAGMGGSGIGASIVTEWAQNQSKYPIKITKDYSIPAFVNEQTLFIASSYSGNTEETLAAAQHAQSKGAQVYVICSGGLLETDAIKNQFPFLKIPDGMPPRAALGYSLTLLAQLFHLLGIASFPKLSFDAAANLIIQEQDNIKAEALVIAQKIHQTIPVVFCSEGFEGSSIRACQQFNENAKMLCWHSVVPEMNHNELVAWNKKYTNLSALFVRSNLEFYRNTKRLDILQNHVKPYVVEQIILQTKGQNLVEQNIYLIHLVDWISFYASELNEVDVNDIEVLINLKKELAHLA